MQFLLILAVLAALAAAECAPPQPVSALAGRLLLAGGAISLAPLWAMVTSGWIARRLRTDSTGHCTLLGKFRRLRRIHAALWLLGAGVVLYCLDWGQIVRYNWHLKRAFLVDELLILAPVLLPLVLSWAAFYEVDRAVRLAADSQADTPPRVPSRGQYVSLHARHYLGILLVPVLGLLAAQDALELLAPSMTQNGREGVVFIPLLAMLFLLFPVLLRCIWDTCPLPCGPLRNRLEEIAAACGFRCREILVWRTGGMVVNAAVAGLVRPLRYVFLSDGLLARLDNDEIETVFGHEVGHVRHHHLVLRVLAMIAPLSLLLLAEQAFPQSSQRFQQWLGAASYDRQAEVGLLLLGAIGLYMLVIFGYYSRLLEHQADLYACRRPAPELASPAVETFARALEKLAIGSGSGRNARGWQHASIARRIDFLERLRRAPKGELRFQRWVRLLGILWVGIVISPVVYGVLLG